MRERGCGRAGPGILPATSDIHQRLDIVDVHRLAVDSVLAAALRVAVLVELEAAVAILGASEGVGLVDLGRLGELAVGFQGTGLVGCVLEAVMSIPGQHDAIFGSGNQWFLGGG